MATADDLLVSISKDADLITWSMKNKVETLMLRFCCKVLFRRCMEESSFLDRLTVSAFIPRGYFSGWSQAQFWCSLFWARVILFNKR